MGQSCLAVDLAAGYMNLEFRGEVGTRNINLKSFYVLDGIQYRK